MQPAPEKYCHTFPRIYKFPMFWLPVASHCHHELMKWQWPKRLPYGYSLGSDRLLSGMDCQAFFFVTRFSIIGPWFSCMCWCLSLKVTPKGGWRCLMSPSVWNLRAVIWFHSAISCLVHLPAHIALSVFFFFSFFFLLLPTGPFSWLFFPPEKFFSIFC